MNGLKQDKVQRMNPEVMKTPELVVQEERGAQLFSLLLKAANPAWGETETPLAIETTEYLSRNPLPQNILGVIRDFQEEGVDEETLYNFALAYQHPERAEGVLDMVAKYKPHVKNPAEKYKIALTVLTSLDQAFSVSPLAAKFAIEIENDKKERLRRLEVTRTRIQRLIDFFKPDPKTSDIRRVNLVPTDPLHRKDSGVAFSVFQGEQIIISHIDNTLNQDHEFSHGIINPIVEKLSGHLTDEQETKVTQLASGRLKQDYGARYFSLLCEEFIRTYTELVSQEKKPQTYDDFVAKIAGTTEDEFQKYLAEGTSLRDRCEQLGISTIADFKDNALEYYEQFEKNLLRDLIYRFYQDYSSRHDKSKNFEQFVIEKFPALLN